jgi:Alr-MurF fusion protein
MFTIAQILHITQGNALQINHAETEIMHLLIDSRKPAFLKSALFFAITGKNHDGHQFIQELYQKGVRNFVVEHLDIHTGALSEANIIQVPDATVALQQIVARHRQKFFYPVIAITGSNAKTIVKEWLTQLLSPDFDIIKSPKSYNSQVGVPLSVWQMNDSYQLGIFEAGISKPNEMAHLQTVIQPSIGIFTNIGSAHDEGFENREQKIKEKLKLFAKVDKLFYCLDYKEIHKAVKLSKRVVFTWSFKQKADLQVIEMKQVYKATLLFFTCQNNDYQMEVPFTDKASLENIIHCIAVMFYFKIDIKQIQKRIQMLRQVSMRLEMKQGTYQSYLIDDSYNNDLAGLGIALDFLTTQKQKPQKTAIISDILESGMDEATLYQSIAKMLEDKEINALIGIGEVISTYQDIFPLKKYFFKDVESFLNEASNPLSPCVHALYNSVVLVKGARVFAFERIIQRLQQKAHGTRLEINLDALVHNLNFYRSLLNQNDGHGQGFCLWQW